MHTIPYPEEEELHLKPSFSSTNSLINNYDKNFHMLRSLSSLSNNEIGGKIDSLNSNFEDNFQHKEYPLCIEESQNTVYPSRYKIAKNFSLRMESEIMNVRVNQNGSLVACGLLNGFLTLVDLENGRFVKNFPTSFEKFSVSSIRWKPGVYGNNVITATNVDGSVSCFNCLNGKLVYRIIHPEKSQILSLDYSPDGSMFAFGTNKGEISLYNEYAQKEIRTFGAASNFNNGHSNRVFSLKFLTDDHNVFVSGGWDGIIFIWDVRDPKV